MSDVEISKFEDQVQELEKKFAELGLKYFRLLYSTLKTASLYEANNNRYVSQANELRQIVDRKSVV